MSSKLYEVQTLVRPNLTEFKLLEQGGGVVNLNFARLIVQHMFFHPTKAFLTVYTVEIPTYSSITLY